MDLQSHLKIAAVGLHVPCIYIFIVLLFTEPATWYELKLTAENDLGDGPPSVRTVRTLSENGEEGDPSDLLPPLPLPPDVIEVEPLDGGELVRIAWKKPDEKDTGVSYYTIHYEPVHQEHGVEYGPNATAAVLLRRYVKVVLYVTYVQAY